MLENQGSSSSVAYATSRSMSKDGSPVSMRTKTYDSRVTILISALALLLAAMLLVLFPGYQLHVNKNGSAYCSLLFVYFCTSVLLVFLCCVRKVWDKTFSPKQGLVFTELWRTGLIRGVSTMLIVYSFDQERVPCHIQEVVLSSSVVLLILRETFFYLRGDQNATRKPILCLLTFFGGLFFSLTPGTADSFTCHGSHSVKTAAPQQAVEMMDESTPLWTLVSVCGVMLISWNSLRRSHLDQTVREHYPLKKPHRLAALTFTTVVSFLTIVCMFWTDLFSTVGKGHGFNAFAAHLSGGLYCHFSTSEACSSTMAYGWLFTLAFVLHNFTIWHLFFLTRSKSLPLLLSSAGLSVSMLWWCFFEMRDGAMLWSPRLGGGFVAVLVGILVAAGSLYAYCRDRVSPSKIQLMTSSSRLETEI